MRDQSCPTTHPARNSRDAVQSWKKLGLPRLPDGSREQTECEKMMMTSDQVLGCGIATCPGC